MSERPEGARDMELVTTREDYRAASAAEKKYLLEKWGEQR